MRFTSLTIPLLLLLLPLLTSAGAPPSCTLTCVYKSLGKASCGVPSDIGKHLSDHLKCLCRDPEFRKALDICIAESGECDNREEVDAAKAAAGVSGDVTLL
ncbi:hypothetical protein C7212DRAFT_361907 [Tuber magnatum]|uniref:CFEM domain-containing protein n=1 Tax=Tuber magnatum TaxID=42249 RepID=A0A317SYD2_9PEZI|nr:hypothetical protein C7212DRAFT_361907 [Tuber magnatum]